MAIDENGWKMLLQQTSLSPWHPVKKLKEEVVKVQNLSKKALRYPHDLSREEVLMILYYTDRMQAQMISKVNEFIRAALSGFASGQRSVDRFGVPRQVRAPTPFPVDLLPVHALRLEMHGDREPVYCRDRLIRKLVMS